MPPPPPLGRPGSSSFLLLLSPPPPGRGLKGERRLAERLVEMVRGEVRGCKDVPRICSAANVACCLIGSPPPSHERAVHLLASLLANRYPKVQTPPASTLISKTS